MSSPKNSSYSRDNDSSTEGSEVSSKSDQDTLLEIEAQKCAAAASKKHSSCALAKRMHSPKKKQAH